MAFETLKSKLAEAPKKYESGMPEAFKESMLGKYQSRLEEVKLQKGKAQRWAKGKALLGEATRSLLKESFDPNSPLTGMEMQNRLLTAWAQAGVGEDIISKFATPQMMEKLMDSQQSFFNRMRGDRTEEMETKDRRARLSAGKGFAPTTTQEEQKEDIYGKMEAQLTTHRANIKSNIALLEKKDLSDEAKIKIRQKIETDKNLMRGLHKQIEKQTPGWVIEAIDKASSNNQRNMPIQNFEDLKDVVRWKIVKDLPQYVKVLRKAGAYSWIRKARQEGKKTPKVPYSRETTTTKAKAGKVILIHPDGKEVYVPRNEVKSALQQGYKRP